MELGHAIEEAFRAGQLAWSDVVVDPDAFADHVRTLSTEAILRCGSDLYLAFACLHGVATALAHFERTMLAPARAAIGSFDSSEPFVDEGCQRLRTQLLVGDGQQAPRIASYAGHGPLRAWVGVAAARTALMMLRSTKRKREIHHDDWADAIAGISIGSPELDLVKKQHTVAFTTAFREAVAALEPRLRSALRMHFADGLSIDEIGAAYAVHRATAARWIQRARDVLFDETRRILSEKLVVSSTELDRVTALVRSQLDVSFSQLLPREPATPP